MLALASSVFALLYRYLICEERATCWINNIHMCIHTSYTHDKQKENAYKRTRVHDPSIVNAKSEIVSILLNDVHCACLALEWRWLLSYCTPLGFAIAQLLHEQTQLSIHTTFAHAYNASTIHKYIKENIYCKYSPNSFFPLLVTVNLSSGYLRFFVNIRSIIFSDHISCFSNSICVWETSFIGIRE